MPQHAHARSQTLTFAAARMPIILPRCVYGPQLAEDVKTPQRFPPLTTNTVR